MDPEKVKVILKQPDPCNFKDLQQFLGFANYYRRYIAEYFIVARLIFILLQKNIRWIWSGKHKLTFNTFKNRFLLILIIKHFRSHLATILKPNALNTAMAAVLLQQHLKQNGSRRLYPIIFQARRLLLAERNYGIRDRKLLIIVDAFRDWRALLCGV